jgi:predicted O-methyltransferase YrrM
MLSDRWHEVKCFLRHAWRAKGPHGVHSPFVYNLITRVLRNKSGKTIDAAIVRERKRLLNCADEIEVRDFGAGSRVNSQAKRRVSEIARSALQPASHARVMAVLAGHAHAKNILELGTSLGITTACIASALPESKVYTIEGCAGISAQARRVWEQVGLNSIDLTTGSFSDVLMDVLSRMPTVDFVIIDGDHRGRSCLEYLETILPFTHENTVIVLDDIYWSPSMTEAWETIIGDQRFTLTLDFFDFGVLYRTTGRVKEHFMLKRPW